ncbi:hypothetical protein Xcc3_31990 [Xanthomonas campestris pv. campestris]|nr:hypothetical protein Xcc3_31990 [Xanthomonas campestris pv. campestris]
MPEAKTRRAAAQDKREGKSASTQAGEYVKEEIEHVREGKHGAKSTKQAIAIGLSKARRDGVDAKPSKSASKRTKKKAAQDSKTAKKTAARTAKKTTSKTTRKTAKKATKKATKKTTKQAAKPPRRPRPRGRQAPRRP